MLHINKIKFVLALAAASCIPASAANVTWTFGQGPSHSSTVNNQDGSTLSGSFVYDAASGAFGLFGDPSAVFTVAGTGTGDPTTPGAGSNPSNPLNPYPVIPTSGLWYIRQTAPGCCSTSNQITLVNSNAADLTDILGDNSGVNAFGIGIVFNDAMTDLLPNSTVYNPITYLIAGQCITTDCDVWNSSAGFPIVNSFPLFATTFDDDGNVVTLGSYITASRGADPDPDPGPGGDVPEPSTFFLAGSVLMAVGFGRRKLTGVFTSK